MSSPILAWIVRPQKVKVIILASVVVVTCLELLSSFFRLEVVRPVSKYYRDWGKFETIELPGFLNTGNLEQQFCDSLNYHGSINIQQSSHLHDDLQRIALSLETHPIVDYGALLEDPNLTVEDVIERTWYRLSGSSVWLPQQQVFLLVTRVMFLGEQQRMMNPKASFLRGQIFDENWQHQEGYTINWAENSVTFPLIFDIPTRYEGGPGEYYGPEDPRIILEENVDGTEPVIIFNMAHERSHWDRAMYTFRPFSAYLTILSIRDEGLQATEKNWAPFFLPAADSEQQKSPKGPEEYIHFVYNFKPLEILKCHLRHGDCDMIFKQRLPDKPSQYDDRGSLHGGTNFVTYPIPKNAGVHKDVQVYVAFPRTNVGWQCGNGVVNHYRPEFIVMVSFRGSFHIAFASEALDFGSAILELDEDDDPCDKGRILIPNSISKWDVVQDIMTVSFSVDDRTVQIARLYGLFYFVRGLPQFRDLFQEKGPLGGDFSNVMITLSSWRGDDVCACSIESAVNATVHASEQHARLFPES